jgi:hypothetical protein
MRYERPRIGWLRYQFCVVSVCDDAGLLLKRERLDDGFSHRAGCDPSATDTIHLYKCLASPPFVAAAYFELARPPSSDTINLCPNAAWLFQ